MVKQTVAQWQEINDKIEAYKTKNNVGDKDACKALGLKAWQAPYARKILKKNGKKKFGKVVKKNLAKRNYTKRAPVMQTLDLTPETTADGKVLMMFGSVDNVIEAAKKLLVQ